MPKKIFWLILLSSCTKPYEGILYHYPKNCKFRVLTTITILYDFAKEIGGDRACVESLVPVGNDPHKYEPVPSDIVRISKADIILANGHNLENWLLKLLSNKREDAIYYEIAENIELVNNDPHLWMDVNYAKIYAKNIKELFSKIDKEGAIIYEMNYERYVRKLDELNNFISCVVSKIPNEDRKLVTTHDAYSYFAMRYGFEFIGSIWGISTEDEPSIKEIRNLVDLVRKTKTKALFIETTVNPRIMESISKETGVRMGGKLYGNSIGKEGSNAENYIKMQIHNIITIYEGITGNSYKNECDGELKNIKSYNIL